MFKNVQFLTSVYKLDQIPQPRLPEFVLAGRSNVGKSSLLNMLTGRKKLAMVSSTPGKTRALNYFSVNEQYYLVDLPGFGYAKVEKTERERWEKLIISYLSQAQYIKTIFHLIDSRHAPTALDKEMRDFVNFYGLPYAIILTKTDKIKRNERNVLIKQLKENGFLEQADQAVFFTSSVSGEGKNEIQRFINSLL
ncbi:MAG: ribosome biogenesis GTP-binding protein YihA/YsxC [Ignavibacteria bacterium]|nr:ribosome biogenesis GTP-binding protein YihA/YsxC [Ignavibacteria bacterium]